MVTCKVRYTIQCFSLIEDGCERETARIFLCRSFHQFYISVETYQRCLGWKEIYIYIYIFNLQCQLIFWVNDTRLMDECGMNVCFIWQKIFLVLGDEFIGNRGTVLHICHNITYIFWYQKQKTEKKFCKEG